MMLQDQDLSPPNIVQTKKALLQYFGSSSFMRRKCANKPTDQPAMTQINAKDTELLDLLMIPYKNKDDSPEAQCESYVSSLWKLRDQVLSMNCPSFTRNVSERDWLKSSAKIWELVKSSPIIAEYSRTLLSSDAIFDNISPLSCQAFKYHIAVRVAEIFDSVGYQHYWHLVMTYKEKWLYLGKQRKFKETRNREKHGTNNYSTQAPYLPLAFSSSGNIVLKFDN
ncbi:hypothetical protein GOBAR_AA17077 [Gossypium barbadense]|uniref:Uncharacterized protein n=1 Tax=Gossypium barbadense TaxID=3634 RepID=A0A2P5XJU2_GOSBA|nr:hypothetical protein GOBAR_AA17077 [Gossypium barbadense]